MPLHPVIVAGVFLLAVLATALALLGLFLVWRNGYVRGWRASRSAPPKCPQCGYDLTGLAQCRCPECGREFGLEEVAAFVPNASLGKKARQEG